MSQCTELVDQLQNIKKFQTELNQEIEEFSDLKKDAAAKTAIKTQKLLVIYGIRKDILKSELIRGPLIDSLLKKPWAEFNTKELQSIIEHIKEKTEKHLDLTRMQTAFLYQIGATDENFGEAWVADIWRIQSDSELTGNPDEEV